MKNLLIVTHAPSTNTQLLVTAMLDAIDKQQLAALTVTQIPALQATAADVMQAHAIILFTPENLSYMSGAMKDFFDRIYYPCLDECQGLPISLIVRAGHDGTGTVRAITTIINGLKWSWAQQPLICKGPWRPDFLNEAALLAVTVAVSLDCGII